MKAEILSIAPFVPNLVGEKRHHFRVCLRVNDREIIVDMSADEIVRFREFQKVVLAKEGVFANFSLSEANDEFDAFRRWQTILENARWQPESDDGFRSEQAEGMTEEDASEPFYRFADNE